MKENTYPKFNIGDRVVKFNYANTNPLGEGEVMAQTDHFVKVLYTRGTGFFAQSGLEWWSKADVELVKD